MTSKGPCRTMIKTKLFLTAAAVSVAFALPALAQDAKSNLGAAKPVEAGKTAPVATPAAAPAVKPAETPKAPAAGVTNTSAPGTGASKPADAGKTEAPKK